MSQPEDFVKGDQSHLVCRLHKSLYELKQAPRAWFDKFQASMFSLGLRILRLICLCFIDTQIKVRFFSWFMLTILLLLVIMVLSLMVW